MGFEDLLGGFWRGGDDARVRADVDEEQGPEGGGNLVQGLVGDRSQEVHMAYNGERPRAWREVSPGSSFGEEGSNQD